MTNRLFGEQSFAFERSFLNLTDAGFGAPLEKVDFIASSEAQRVHINDWVAKQTESRIKDLLGSGTIDSNTKLVLVNAIYFLADWASPFTREQTRDESFIVDKATIKNVATMHQQGSLRMTKSGKASVLELPYQGDDTAMWIVLPDAANGLAAVEAGLSAKQIAKWNASLKAEELSVSLPKFEVNPAGSLLLNDALKKLGIKDAFDEKKANFDGISPSKDANKRLFITSVVHKAFVKVDEKGTEAAAATAVVMASKGAMPMPAKNFKVDHPFLFMIVDKKTGLVLFMGRVVDPSQK
jgi:serpin B